MAGQQPISFTQEGFSKIQTEYDDLLSQRPHAVEELKKARELGDLSENGYYKASRARLSFIDSRLLQLKGLIKNAKLITVSSTDKVSMGCVVILENDKQKKEYRIVSKFEANPAEGKISDVSPIGKALIGKRTGDTVHFSIPAGSVSYTIVKITR